MKDFKDNFGNRKFESSKSNGGLIDFNSYAARANAEVTMNRQRIEMWGALVDDVLLDEAVARIEGWVRNRRQNPQFGAQQVVVLNPSYLAVAQKDVALLEIVNRAAMVVPESIGAIQAIKALRRPLRGRVKALDLVHALAKQSAQLRSERVLRLFLLGTNAEKASAKLQEQYPGVQIVGVYSGKSETVAAEMVSASRADIVLVAYGVGRQDRWIMRHLQSCGAVVGIGVGDIFGEISSSVPETKTVWAHALPRLISTAVGRTV
jgi:N-acetylglucosaminyldiphosphoundecaprenol N-acetyl-beta-D-mannosaminyltransferase